MFPKGHIIPDEGLMILVNALRAHGIESVREATIEEMVAVMGPDTDLVAEQIKAYVEREGRKTQVVTIAK